MSTTTAVSASRTDLIGRRGELLAELFLQDLGPVFLAQPTTDFGYDFFVGFSKPDGGINTYAVEVKATERPVNGKYQMRADQYRRLANSNIPVLLLVVAVKRNRLFYAWPDADLAPVDRGSIALTIPVVEVNDEVRTNLRKRLVG